MHTDHTQLDSIEPSDAQELYLKYRATEVTEKTLQVHRYRTNRFVQRCDEENSDDVSDVTGRHLQGSDVAQNDGDLAWHARRSTQHPR